ncbi:MULTISPECIES: MocR-like pyridoxine biosynthesis transcription factor PdxR [Bacillus]|uniref:MocR-like pyridoxine biosynthesis transcription factor PdxR n=1 Tax=Bacillus TaxID=1386 RepID=UPI000856C7A6|nr:MULTISPECIES: PLP-dependent aminotransferase family protein [Bacillus]AZJ20782.1 PLP-dependent aminotransferase family protein [Bacillus wiedmannii bv. thuringiensis]KAA0759498.1 PLP-dependent aminotransferase family protein [Bacillus sp. AR2-1]MCU5329815.1 PLP-dependent aminotransferase family protein [Bacillus wiedmannii]OWT49681.1 PLP-dependent aminotransferase family protein [Bacillus sp. K2I17]QWH66691.1 PLP-dependent aminotransferase family protein [Bacillus wiedmannii]
MTTNKKLPKYRQIVNFMKEKIENGEWPIGSKIPSQRQLAKLFHVNRSTVITALDELMADGLIQGKIGAGTIVTNNTWSLLATNPPPDWSDYVKAGIHKPSKLMVREINEAEANKELIHLSKGELAPQIFPLETMQSIMKSVSDEIDYFGYEEQKGFLPLREAISTYVKSFGIHTSASSILIVSGALQALQLISIGLLHRESTVLLEQPSYLYSLHVFQSANINLSGICMDNHGILPNELLKRIKYSQKKNILYSIPSFQNPTGALMSQERRKEIIKICEKEQLPIIEDDIYRELWIDEPSPPPLKSIDKHGHVLYVGSLSKTLSPGLRIGWIIGPEPVIDRLSDIKMQTDYGSSSLSQRVAAEWINKGFYEEHVANVRIQLKERRQFMIRALNKYCADVASWDIPSGGLFIWLKIVPNIPMKKLFSEALSKGILLNPGRIYEEESDRYIRLSYGYVSPEQITSGIKLLSELIRKLMA